MSRIAQPRSGPVIRPRGGRRPVPAASKAEADNERFLYAGLVRLHVLYHASKEPVFGLAMIEELGRHGYKLSAGTLYPILHGLEDRGLAVSREERVGRSRRRVYEITAAGRVALLGATQRVKELLEELTQD